ncbi:MAG: alkaline phosphatase family protein, partial [Phycisphaerae bacterium]
MSYQHFILVSMPGLRTRDLEHMPRLRAMAEEGAATELIPTFPCVTSPVQANMLTGTTPIEHGIIGNGFYHRDRGEVELWVGRNGLIEGDQVWDTLARRGVSQAAWIPQNIKDAAADFIVTPEPIHHPDGRTELWCYSKPDGLYEKLLKDVGHFPLMHFWGPMSNIRSTEWIVNAALWLLQRERPRFNYVYVPHLDYQAQKHGPNSDQQAA